jgi:hydantoinase/carbamoylase family amidase
MKFGTELMRQAEALGQFTEDPPLLTRTYLSPQHRQAGNYLIGLMQRAGMTANFDALGNIVGRYEAADPAAPVVMTGSHQDSVRNAGKFDGLFGILTAIACVKDLHERGRKLPYTLEIVGFGDEEGVRFGVALMGSKAMAGSFEPSWLDKADDAGVTLRRALADFGGDPDAWPSLGRRGRVAAYVESHIEQGPVLLNVGLPVGVVTAIAGGSRIRVAVKGLAGHAGTVPMGSRQDALAAASEMVLFVEKHCETHEGLVGTVGKLAVLPGAINVIPQEVEFTIDVRSGDDALRHAAVAAFQSAFEEIAARRRVAVVAAPFYAVDAAPCDAALQEQFAQSIAAHGIPVRRLPSGAGHDAMVFPAICPMAMLFVRCGNNGISHHPDETMTAADADTATSVLLHFLEHFDAAAFAATTHAA